MSYCNHCIPQQSPPFWQKTFCQKHCPTSIHNPINLCASCYWKCCHTCTQDSDYKDQINGCFIFFKFYRCPNFIPVAGWCSLPSGPALAYYTIGVSGHSPLPALALCTACACTYYSFYQSDPERAHTYYTELQQNQTCVRKCMACIICSEKFTGTEGLPPYLEQPEDRTPIIQQQPV